MTNLADTLGKDVTNGNAYAYSSQCH